MTPSTLPNGAYTGAPHPVFARPQHSQEATLMATDIQDIVEKLARLEERSNSILQRIDHLATATVSRESLVDIERRMLSLETDRAKIGWIVMAAVLAALLALVVGAAPLLVQ